MPVRFAANYSPRLAKLVSDGKVTVDVYKCPSWEPLIIEALQSGSVYVHFPLNVGLGIDDAYDREQRQPADWKKVERLMTLTGTTIVNLHMSLEVENCPDVPALSLDAVHVEVISGRLLRDVRSVVQRFGAGNVIVEAGFYEPGYVRATFLPEVIQRVVAETGCGFLLDVSHASLAAMDLGMDGREYIRLMPLHRVREFHITGIRPLAGIYAERLRAAGDPGGYLKRFDGNLIDHLPMTAKDWDLFGWAMQQIHAGEWQVPEIVSFEYGGVSGFWSAIMEESVLTEQIPRLYAMVKENNNNTRRINTV